MNYDKFYNAIIYEVVESVNKRYPFEKLDRELKMDYSINNELLLETINEIIKPILSILKTEQKDQFIEYCEIMNQNNMNVMIAVKYEDNNMYARSFVEHKTCGEICKYLQYKLDKEQDTKDKNDIKDYENIL